MPFDQNPERALGVIFDSYVTPALHADGAEKGTRLTVMLGGHHWNGWSALPSDDEAVALARAVLERHLGVPASTRPLAVRARVHTDCIPQYNVGHAERMRDAHAMLKARFQGRVRVAGSWYTGVGVNDCLRSAWETARGLARGQKPKWKRRGEKEEAGTGLESFLDGGRPMALIKKRADGVVEVLKADKTDKRFDFWKGVSVGR